MRVTSGLWVGAYIRRAHGAGAFAVVRRRGAEEAGAIFVVLNRLDGSSTLFGPAPQSAFEGRASDRIFAEIGSLSDDPAAVEQRLEKERRFDPDLWIVEIEDRAGRHFLDLAPAP